MSVLCPFSGPVVGGLIGCVGQALSQPAVIGLPDRIEISALRQDRSVDFPGGWGRGARERRLGALRDIKISKRCCSLILLSTSATVIDAILK